MAESIIKDFKGKSDWVYVGKAKATEQSPEAKRADTLYNEYMQKVFDVAAPVAISEMDEAAAIQGLMAVETVGLLGQEKPNNKQSFANKWLEWEKKFSTPEHQNRLGKLLTGMVYMGGSFGLDYGADVLADALFLKRESIPTIIGKPFKLKDGNGNREMLNAGWEYVTDMGIEKITDWSVKKIANREDVGFVSPLSRALGKLGNTAINVFGDINSRDKRTLILKSVINPGFIEGAFRFAGAIPGGGIIKEIYGWANHQIMKGEGAIPFGADLAFNMLFAKMLNKERPIVDNVHKWERE